MLLRNGVQYLLLASLTNAGLLPGKNGKQGQQVEIKFDRSKVFDKTIKEFFDERGRFTDISDASSDIQEDTHAVDYKIPKLDSGLLEWAYFMFQFTYPAAMTVTQKEGQKPICGKFKCGYLLDLKDVIVQKRLFPTRPTSRLPQWDFYNQHGLIITDKDRKMIFVVMKGAYEVLQKVKIIKTTPFQPAEEDFGVRGGAVQARALSALNEVYEDARESLLSVWKQHKDYTVVFGGHSFGASVATLLAMKLLHDPKFTVDDHDFNLKDEGVMKIYSSGATRHANTKFNEAVMGKFPDLVRFTRGNDPITNLPVLSKGFTHTPVEVWTQHATSEDGLNGDITIPTSLCTGYTNNICNGKYWPVTAGHSIVLNYRVVQEHMDYFGHTYDTPGLWDKFVQQISPTKKADKDGNIVVPDLS